VFLVARICKPLAQVVLNEQVVGRKCDLRK
jgi:hypothetical protein